MTRATLLNQLSQTMLKELLAGAIGYGIASATDSKVVGDIIDNNISTKSIEDIIRDYAKRHLDIYTCNNEFAHRIHKIAEGFEEYNYKQVYGN